MKYLFTILILISSNAFAKVETAKVYVPEGIMPNPILAPLGQLVNADTGEVLYVKSVVSVLSPDMLNADCLYSITYTRGKKIKSQVQLVPPMTEVSCGHDFGDAK